MVRQFRQHGNQGKSRRRIASACGRAVELLEGRQLLAAHILGSSTVYSTIQAAVNAAPAGATVTVDAGNYAEMVTVSKPLTLQGAQAGVDARGNTRAAAGTARESVITGYTGSSGVSTSFYVTASDVTIDGFIVQGATSSYNMGGGIVLAPNTHGAHILNNIIRNNFTGMLLANNSATDPAIIQHNYFLNNNGAGNNNSRSIYSDGGVSGGLLTNVVIDGNAFIVNKFNSGAARYEGCIALEGRTTGDQQNITITNNVMDGNGKLLLYNCQNVDIEHNLMTHSLDQWSGTFRFEGGCVNVTVKYNTVYNNTGPGLSADSKGFGADNSGFVVEYNNFYNNNTAYNNKYSVAVTAATYDGVFDAKNNYWGAANGPSGQGTGSGDMIWGNGYYYKGTNGGWSTGAGSEVVFAPYSTTPNGTLSTPYSGLPSSAAAPIQAEDFDNGGNGNGYLTAATSNAGGQYRTGEKVGIETTTDSGGGYDVGYTRAGQWYDYTASVAYGGTYSLSFRIANAQATGGKFHLNIDGTNVTGTLTAPATGGYQSWTTLTVNNVNIAAGKHVLRLVMDANGSGGSIANFNWIQLTPTGVVAPPAAPGSVTASAASATVVNIAWNETSTNQTGFVVQRSADGVNFVQIGVAAASATKYSDTTATAGTTYWYRIYATSAAGNSSNSSAVSVTTPIAATAPTGLTAVAASATQINLAWSDSSPAVSTGFIIQRATGTSTAFTQVGATGAGAVSFSDTTAAAGNTYTYRVLATSIGGTSAPSATASATTFAAGLVTTYLSDINWVSATAGWNSVEKDLSVAGNPLTLNGVTYAKGLGTHAVSTIVYSLAGGFTNFISDIGVDGEELNKGGAVDFQVLGDNGAVLYDSGVLTNASATVNVNVDVTGVQTLTLVATNGIAGSIDYDHADWAGARLLSPANQPPAAPSGLSAVAASSTQVNLAWTNNAPSATGFVIQRATGVSTTFAEVGTTGAAANTFTDTTAAAGVTYTYRVLAVSAAGNSAPSATASATTPAANAVTTYLSDLNWVSATAGWNTVQKDLTVVGNAITLKGVVYPKGLGTHAVSNIVYNLGGGFASFIADVGIDDEELSRGTGAVDFQVLGDNGTVLFDSGVLSNSSATVSLNVNVTGVQTLTLVATNGVAGSIDYDHADWAGARLISAPAAPAATAGDASTTLTAARSISASQIVTGGVVDVAYPWANASIGNVSQFGTASNSGSSFTISGAGTGVAGTGDALDYVYQSLAGNGTIVARVATTQTGASQAGILIRENLAAGSKEAGLLLTRNGVRFVHRSRTGGIVAANRSTSSSLPQWVKMVRKGKLFTAFTSRDGAHWKKAGSTSIQMNATVEFGLASSSGGSALGTSLFSDVAVG